MFLKMSPTKFKNRRVHTKATYLLNICELVLVKMWNEKDVAMTAAACVILSLETKNTSKKRYWVRLSLLAKQKYSGNDLMTDLKRHDIGLSGELRCNGSFKNFLRMSSADFEYLINLVGDRISKKDTNYRQFFRGINQLDDKHFLSTIPLFDKKKS
ncbi:uncharacterized protein LOC112693663 [Sipha flava]|uniref:Uncharacterized protein LOC112693663 n=1 Tax=Sipha flava TaxID=143950 RepID=A0A8B8GPU2_9HEMI|nr:uncharacterized protein LOC112693663 [Sipha flava]